MADLTRVKILYTLNSSSQLLLARTRLPLPPHPQTETPFLPLPLPHILTTILRSSPELCSDPARDWSVYALDPRESGAGESGRRGSGAMGGVMEGRGLLSWVIGGEEEVVGRVGEAGEVEVGLRLQETKAITQQAHHAALAVLTRSPAPGTPTAPTTSHTHTHTNPSSASASAQASPFFGNHALRPPHSSPLGLGQQQRPAGGKRRARQPLAPLRGPYHRTSEAARPVKHSASSPAPSLSTTTTTSATVSTSVSTGSSRGPAPSLQLPKPKLALTVDTQRIKSEPSPSPLPSPACADPPQPQPQFQPVVGLGLALPRSSAPQPPADPAQAQEQSAPSEPKLPPGPIPPDALKSIADLLRKENGQGLLSALAGFLGVGKCPVPALVPGPVGDGEGMKLEPPAAESSKQAQKQQQQQQQPAPAPGLQKKKKEKEKNEDVRGDKENRRPAQPTLVMCMSAFPYLPSLPSLRSICAKPLLPSTCIRDEADQDDTAKDGPCSNCGRVVTTVWRRPKSMMGEEGEVTTQLLCNPCGIYQKNYAIPRPPWMWGDPEGLPKGRKRKNPPPGPSGPSTSTATSIAAVAAGGDSSLPPSSDPLAPNQPIIHIQGEGRKRRKRTVYDPELARVEREGYFGRAVRAVQEEEEKRRAEELAEEVARALGGLAPAGGGGAAEAASPGDTSGRQDREASPAAAMGMGGRWGADMPGSEMEVEGMVDGRAEVLRDLDRVKRALAQRERAEQTREQEREKERVIIELDDDGEVVDSTSQATTEGGTPAALSSQGSATSGGSDADAESKSPEESMEQSAQRQEQEQEPKAPETPYFGALREGGSLFTPADAPSSLCAAGGSSSSYSLSDAPTSPTPNPSQQRPACIPTLLLPQLQLQGEGREGSVGLGGPSPVIPPSSPPGVGQRFDFSGLPPSSPVLLMDREDEDVDVEEMDLTPAGSGEGEDSAEPEEQGPRLSQESQRPGSGQEEEEEERDELMDDDDEHDDLARFLQGEMSSEDIEGLFMVQEQRASPGKHTSHNPFAQLHPNAHAGHVDYSQMGFNFPLDFGMFGPAGGGNSGALSPAPGVGDLPSPAGGMALLGLGGGGGEYSSEATLAGTGSSGMDVDGANYDFGKEFGEYMKELGMGAGFGAAPAGPGGAGDAQAHMQIGAEELEEIFRTLDGDMGVLV
ncbi:hypothetical protein CALCODRAFT_230601 [Calocera cornea HHB12733]|uniref:GATA-type domain-containing protein n=1 Tax=Calocera cornea HHB12733 TaxID=1353952 RepID=A0A165GZ93_9BASI|nr:hypothetical protein CALCODRAFT_230601 [Calocera cornea HHB12733]